MKPQYLLRFDDICPTTNWKVWDYVEEVLMAENIRPILAVIPDNADGDLRFSPPDKDFWNRVRRWQSYGWTIAMHGWQHRLTSPHGGVLGINNRGEFAGLSRSEQKYKLRRASEVLAMEGVPSDLFCAPAHSFDNTTLQLLRDFGFRYISDGFFPFPVVDEFGMMWVPQQLWSYRFRRFGVWTVCFHINEWRDHDKDEFRKATLRFRSAISSFPDVVGEWNKTKHDPFTDAFAKVYASPRLLRCRLKASLQRPGLRKCSSETQG
jgi:predicted deacetylase